MPLDTEALPQLIERINRDPGRGSWIETGSFEWDADDVVSNVLELLAKCTGVKSISLRIGTSQIKPPMGSHWHKIY